MPFFFFFFFILFRLYIVWLSLGRCKMIFDMRILSISVCMRTRDMTIFTNQLRKTIMTSALPEQNSVWQFLRLDIVNINVHTKFYQIISCGLRLTANFIFLHLGLGLASGHEKLHLASPFGRACRCQSLRGEQSKYSYGFKSYDHFY